MASKNRKSKKNSNEVVSNVEASNNPVSQDETFPLTEANTVSNENTATIETPEAVAPVATETKGKGKAKAAPKLSDFKVLRTIELHPAQVELVEKFRGRAKLASADVVADLADSIRARGQQQAIQVREKANEPGKFECVFGNTRLLSALAIVNGYETDGGKKQVSANPNFKVRCEVVECDDESAQVANIVENAQRSAVSPIGNALNQKMLREEQGMSDVAIAKIYGAASSATVSRLKKLLELEEEYQSSVEDGTLTQGAAFLLADVPAGEGRKAVWLSVVDKCKGEDSIGTTPMIDAIKNWRKEEKVKTAPATPEGQPATPADGTATPEGQPADGTAPATPTGDRKFALTVKQFKDLVSAIAADAECPKTVAEGMNVILSTLSGDTSERDFAQWFVANVK